MVPHVQLRRNLFSSSSIYINYVPKSQIGSQFTRKLLKIFGMLTVHTKITILSYCIFPSSQFYGNFLDLNIFKTVSISAEQRKCSCGFLALFCFSPKKVCVFFLSLSGISEVPLTTLFK